MSKTEKTRRAPAQSELDQLADRLELSRRALGLSPAELCRLTGIKPNTYSQYEGAISRPRLEEAKLMKKHLGYSLDWIYEGERAGLPMHLAVKIAETEREDAEKAKAGTR